MPQKTQSTFKIVSLKQNLRCLISQQLCWVCCFFCCVIIKFTSEADWMINRAEPRVIRIRSLSSSGYPCYVVLFKTYTASLTHSSSHSRAEGLNWSTCVSSNVLFSPAISGILFIFARHRCDQTRLPGWTPVQPAQKIRASLLLPRWKTNEQILVRCCEDARGESALRTSPGGKTMNRSFLLQRLGGHQKDALTRMLD